MPIARRLIPPRHDHRGGPLATLLDVTTDGLFSIVFENIPDVIGELIELRLQIFLPELLLNSWRSQREATKYAAMTTSSMYSRYQLTSPD
jgi:hypothetical protein